MWLRRNPSGDKSNKGTFGKALGVAEHLAKSTGKHISTEWYPFFQVYVHESGSFVTYSSPINSIRSSSCECSRGRNARNYCR